MHDNLTPEDALSVAAVLDELNSDVLVRAYAEATGLSVEDARIAYEGDLRSDPTHAAAVFRTYAHGLSWRAAEAKKRRLRDHLDVLADHEFVDWGFG